MALAHMLQDYERNGDNAVMALTAGAASAHNMENHSPNHHFSATDNAMLTRSCPVLDQIPRSPLEGGTKSNLLY